MPMDLNPQRSSLLTLHQAATVHFIKTPKPILFPFKWAVNGEHSRKAAAESRRRWEANDQVGPGPGPPSLCSERGPTPQRPGGSLWEGQAEDRHGSLQTACYSKCGWKVRTAEAPEAAFQQDWASTAAGSLWALESALLTPSPPQPHVSVWHRRGAGEEGK